MHVLQSSYRPVVALMLGPACLVHMTNPSLVIYGPKCCSRRSRSLYGGAGFSFHDVIKREQVAFQPGCVSIPPQSSNRCGGYRPEWGASSGP